MCLQCHHIRTSLQYYVNSTQDNKLDELLGIQENKNQFNSHAIDEKLLRMMEHCMRLSSDNLWKTFETKVNEHEKVKQIRDKMHNLLKNKLNTYIMELIESKSKELLEVNENELDNKLQGIEKDIPKQIKT